MIEEAAYQEALLLAEERHTTRPLFPAYDNEIRRALSDFGGFSSEGFQRVGDNVIIADNTAIVALKVQESGIATLYPIGYRDFASHPELYTHLSAKVWATTDILEDIREAETILTKQNNEPQKETI